VAGGARHQRVAPHSAAQAWNATIPSQFGPIRGSANCFAASRSSACSVASPASANPAAKTTSPPQPRRPAARTTSGTPAAGIATTTASTGSGRSSIAATHGRPCTSRRVGCTPQTGPGKPSAARLRSVASPYEPGRSVAPTTATERGRSSRERSSSAPDESAPALVAADDSAVALVAADASAAALVPAAVVAPAVVAPDASAATAAGSADALSGSPSPRRGARASGRRSVAGSRSCPPRCDRPAARAGSARRRCRACSRGRRTPAPRGRRSGRRPR
jgi:hypothetical protein